MARNPRQRPESLMLVAVLGLLGGACSSGPAEPGDHPGGTILGLVTVNGDPYPGATAWLDGAVQGTVTTGTDGRYAFSGLPLGEYTVGIDDVPALAEFDVRTHLVTIESGLQEVIRDFAGSLVVGVVRGTILVEGTALGGVQVRLSGPDLQRSIVSSPRGDFLFGDVPPGSYLVSITPVAGVRFTKVSEQVVLDDSTLEADVAFTGTFFRQ